MGDYVRVPVQVCPDLRRNRARARCCAAWRDDRTISAGADRDTGAQNSRKWFFSRDPWSMGPERQRGIFTRSLSASGFPQTLSLSLKR